MPKHKGKKLNCLLQICRAVTIYGVIVMIFFTMYPQLQLLLVLRFPGNVILNEKEGSFDSMSYVNS